MVSGKNSKAVRNARAATVTSRSIPWALIAAITAVVLFAGAVFGYAMVRQSEADAANEALLPFTPTAENQDPSRQIEGVVVQDYSGGGQAHVGPDQRVAYTESPPFGGAHDGFWAACNGVVYPQPVRSENLVHSLEHGAVWIAYDPDQVPNEGVEALADRVAGQPFMVMTPFPDMDTPISLQSWGHQLQLEEATDERIDQFIAALRLNRFTYPEVGATCGEMGPGQFSQDDPPPYQPAPSEDEIDNQTVMPEIAEGL